LSPRSPDYRGRLAQFARAHSDKIEGLYLSPLQEDAAEYTTRVVGDIAARYSLDGIHLDYIRFPNEEFDYSASALAEFKAHMLSRMAPSERREYSHRAEGRPFFYTQMFPLQWHEFRREKVTGLLRRLRAAVKSKRPD